MKDSPIYFHLFRSTNKGLPILFKHSLQYSIPVVPILFFAGKFNSRGFTATKMTKKKGPSQMQSFTGAFLISQDLITKSPQNGTLSGGGGVNRTRNGAVYETIRTLGNLEEQAAFYWAKSCQNVPLQRMKGNSFCVSELAFYPLSMFSSRSHEDEKLGLGKKFLPAAPVVSPLNGGTVNQDTGLPAG